jgi:hypothetical protein
MGNIVVYNVKTEDHTSNPNNFYVGRGSIFGNPFTYTGKRSNKAKLSFATREEALEAYKKYFTVQYKENPNFKKAFDYIYSKYEKGEDIYLQCYCKPLPCHGDYIADMLRRKLIHSKRMAMQKGTTMKD